MTYESLKQKAKKQKESAFINLIIFISCLITTIMCGKEITEGVQYGLRIAIYNVVPISFIFSILSDYLIKSGVQEIPILSTLCKKIFGLSSIGARAVSVGLICGFPIGATMLSYSLTHNETEDEEVGYALALATNPSCAFVIISVGMGLYNSYFYGICLYISIIISTIISGIIFKPKTQFISFPHDKARQRFSISDSIKASSHTCLYICAFIVFFSVLIELIENHLPITVFSEILLSFFEIGNGAVRLSALKLNYAIPLTAMMLGSTGLCAYVQVRAFVPDCISMKKYIFMKLTEAIFSFLLCTIIMSIALK